jgi:hypothetical protein
MNVEFSQTDFLNILNINFMKIHPVRTKLFHTDGRTDMTKLIVAFCNFATPLKELNMSVFRKQFQTLR